MTSLKTVSAIRPHITEIDFCGWLGQAAPNQALEYHRGFLALDASAYAGCLKDVERKELHLVARRAWWAAERGLLHLLQRRNGPHDFTYLAIARERPKTLPVSLSSLLIKEAA